MSGSYLPGVIAPIGLVYSVTGRATHLTLKVVNAGSGAVFYGPSGTSITESETNIYNIAAFTYPSTLGWYRAQWYDDAVLIQSAVGLFQTQLAVSTGTTTVLATTAPASINPLQFTIKRGDTDPSIIAQALYQDPANPANMIPWPIPGGSTAKFTMRDSADFTTRTRTSFPVGAPKVHATASIDDNTNGLMSYGWAVGDTDTDGLFRAEFEITSGSEIRTFPVGVDDTRNWIAVTIVDDLDPGINP